MAQKAYNLNTTPNVTRNVSRGNTIVNRNKSSKLGLASKPSDTVVPVPVKTAKEKLINSRKPSPTKPTPKKLESAPILNQKGKEFMNPID